MNHISRKLFGAHHYVFCVIINSFKISIEIQFIKEKPILSFTSIEYKNNCCLKSCSLTLNLSTWITMLTHLFSPVVSPFTIIKSQGAKTKYIKINWYLLPASLFSTHKNHNNYIEHNISFFSVYCLLPYMLLFSITFNVSKQGRQFLYVMLYLFLFLNPSNCPTYKIFKENRSDKQ